MRKKSAKSQVCRHATWRPRSIASRAFWPVFTTREDKAVTDTPKTPMQQLWQQQPVEGTRMSIDEIRRRASRFEKKIMWRNVREYAVAGMASSLFVWFIIQTNKPLFRLACCLMIAGLVYMSYQLHRRASARSLPADLGAVNALQFHRAELERQRDFVADIWGS